MYGQNDNFSNNYNQNNWKNNQPQIDSNFMTGGGAGGFNNNYGGNFNNAGGGYQQPFAQMGNREGLGGGMGGGYSNPFTQNLPNLGNIGKETPGLGYNSNNQYGGNNFGANQYDNYNQNQFGTGAGMSGNNWNNNNNFGNNNDFDRNMNNNNYGGNNNNNFGMNNYGNDNFGANNYGGNNNFNNNMKGLNDYSQGYGAGNQGFGNYNQQPDRFNNGGNALNVSVGGVQTFLEEIQEFIVGHNLSLTILLQEIGIQSSSTHITKTDLDNLGRQARATLLNSQALQELFSQLEDRSKPGHIQIMNLQQRLSQFNVSTDKKLAIAHLKDEFIRKIRDYIDKQKYSAIDNIFPNVLIIGIEKAVEQQDFIDFLISDKMHYNRDDAEKLANEYLGVGNAFGKTNLTKIQQEIEQQQNMMSLTKAKEIVNLIFDQMKKHLAKYDTTLINIFMDSDDNDGYLDRGEIRVALLKFGFDNIPDDYITAFFMVFDPRNTDKTDYKHILDKFSEYANKNMIKEGGPNFKIYDTIRKYMKQKKYNSISSIFLTSEVNKKIEVNLEMQEFLSILKKIVMVEELNNYTNEYKFASTVVSSANTQKVDYHKFADYVGYDLSSSQVIQAQNFNDNRNMMGGNHGFGDSQGFVKGFQKVGIRRMFFRTLINTINSNKMKLENDIRSCDTNLTGYIQLGNFINALQANCPMFSQNLQLIEMIAREYIDNQNPNFVQYLPFIDRVQREIIKLQFLKKIYKNFYDALEFKAIQDLYQLFVQFDFHKDKKFTDEEITKVLAKRGITLAKEELEFLFEEYDPEGLKSIKFSEIEADFRELTADERKKIVQYKEANLPQILQTLKKYMEIKGLGLRQIFGKTQKGDNETIQQYQFTKQMVDISNAVQEMGQGNIKINETAIHKLILEISTQDNKAVSFTELMKLFNSHFHYQDDDNLFLPQQIEQLKFHIAKVSIDRKTNNFVLEDHFQYPSAPFKQFVDDLKREPLACLKTHTDTVLNEMAKLYPAGGNYVNTQSFILDIKECVFKQEQKIQLFFELRKQIMLKNLTIEKAFQRAKPEIEKFNIEYLSPVEFQGVFLFVEYKIPLERIETLLKTFFLPDPKGNYSYIKFIEEFKNVEKSNAQFRGRRFFTDKNDILKRIATQLELRGMKNFGTLLADQDLKGNNTIEEASFFRTLDSLQFGLGEGDIQLLLKEYKKGNVIDLVRFKDDVNPYIMKPEVKIFLKSNLNDVIKERIVENIEQSPRELKKEDLKELQKFEKLFKEIMCGVYVQNSEIVEWFTRYSVFNKGQLTKNEFTHAIEAMNIFGQHQAIQDYYDFLIQRQENYLGYKSQLLNIDQFNMMINKDCNLNREQMIEDILFHIALELTETKLPVQDAILSFDTHRTGLIYRNDFVTSILDNYLRLSQILSINMKQLLVSRYSPTESMINFSYDQFLADLRKKNLEHQRQVKVYMTQVEIDFDKANPQPDPWSNDQQQNQQQQPPAIPDPEANSKKNTVVIEKLVSKQMRISGVPQFYFDDIMIETFRKGVAVEVYFKSFSQYLNREFVISKDQFYEGISSLGVKWGDRVKSNELFDALDMAAHGTITRAITNNDIGEAVLINALYTVEDYQAKCIQTIYQQLKQTKMLAKLRDLFNFFNTRRDNTCQSQEFKSIFLSQLNMKQLVTDQQLDLIVLRYKAMQDASRVSFIKFIKDMEYCDAGISPSLIWAIDLAEDIYKGLIVNGMNSPEQVFNKYAKMQGIILFDEFKRAMDELQISVYHEEEILRDFFNHVEMQQNKDTIQGGGHHNNTNFNKVSMVQLINTIKTLCQKNLGQIYNDILEKIYSESKRNNLSVTVYTIFTEFDQSKSGHVDFQDFLYGIKEKLGIRYGIVKDLDIQVLAKRYKSNQRGVPDEMVQYEKFYQDFERMEKLGLRAGVDPLKEKHKQEVNTLNLQMVQRKEITPESKKTYDGMSGYCKKMGLVDQLCQALVQKDTVKRGYLSYQQIREAFRSFKITLNTNQMNSIVDPLPIDNLDQSYNYLVMIDLLFGREKSLEVQKRYQLQGLQTTQADNQYQQQQPEVQLEINQRFKDLIEINYQQVVSLAHQISKGSYLLRENEFFNVFKSARISLLSQDYDLLAGSFRQLKNFKNNAIDIRQFIKIFAISETTSLIIQQIQKELAIKNIKLDEALLINEQLSYEDFTKFVESTKIDLKKFKEPEIKTFFDQISSRKDKIDKFNFIRIIKNDDGQKEQEWLPFIANELVYYIFNNNINLFKIVNPQAKKLTIPQFNQLLTQINYKPTNPKDMPILIQFFAMEGDAQSISTEKLISQIRKLDPNYGGVNQQRKQAQPANNNKQNFSKQLSQFSQKIKNILKSINDQMKRNGHSSKVMFDQMDTNKNGIIEQQEFVQYFNKDFQVKGLVQADFETLFEALDMNKDGYLSVNEFCLCLDGVQLSIEQRLKSFDLELEKQMRDEINKLFDFFDTNRDNLITLDELQFALRSINPSVNLREAQEIMKQADKNKSNSIDRNEFINLMLPKFKEEMLSYEKNLDDLRRLFKEADVDQSNYLNKDELRNALLKMNVELTDVQMDDLMRELDVDQNNVVDIDEFIAFLTIADQLKFKNPSSKATIIRIRQARKLQPMDFYNCFKNLPQFFLPSFTQETFEKKYMNTPSWGLYPEFDNKTMNYKDLQKLEQVDKIPQKKFIEHYQPNLACEIQIEEASGVPLPKKDDFEWSKISHREIRAVLIDMRTHEFLSNSFIIGASWRNEYQGKWLFNTNESMISGKNFIMRTDLFGKLPTGQEQNRDIHLIFELVLYTNQGQTQQQITCAWGSIPINQLDKSAKQKITLKGGSPFFEQKIDQAEVHQEKKGFAFLKKIANQNDDGILTINVKPFAKFQETTQYQISTLPSTCLISKKLLSFAMAFRVYCYRKLTKAQQQMIAPQGNFAIAQFRKIFDNPDINFILGDCWDIDVNQKLQNFNLEAMIKKMEEFMMKLYAIIYSAEFKFDHIYPTRSSPLESEKFFQRENMIKSQLMLGKYKLVKEQVKSTKKKEESKQQDPIVLVDEEEDYKPFNIAEMEIQMSGIDPIENKQDELLKMYQQMGLIY